MTGITSTQTLFRNGVSTDEAAKTTGADAMKSAATTPAKNSAVDASAGQVKLSSTAGALLSNNGDVRMDKVASLQAAIASGSYAVSSSDVADKLIEHMLG